MIKLFRLYILFVLLSSAGVFVFADEPSSNLDDKPTVDNAAVSGVQVPALPADTATETQTNYLYDLKKLIDKSRENIKEVNEKIKEQAVLKRNQAREERAREYYDKGVALTNEGKLDEAREYFEKAIRITEHPEMTGYIKESQRRLRKQENALQAQEREHYKQIKEDESTRKEDVEAAYKEAVDLYKQKKYHPAKDAFMHVDEIAPDYRATSSYLKILDQDIILADALAVKQQAVEVERQQKEAEAARAKEKAMWLAQIEQKEKERKEAVDKQAGEVYDEAVALYKIKKFAAAKKKFEEVSWVIPNYKATMKYLARIDRDAQEEQERVAQEQEKALKEQRWEDEVEHKKQELRQQQELEVKERQHKKDLEDQAQFLYTAAVSLFDQKNMDEALEKFNDIEKLTPDFKSTRAYIARIDQWDFDHHRQPPINVNINPAVVVPSEPTPGAVVTTPSPQEGIMPAQIKVAVSLEDQQKQAQDIAALADKAAQLYRQVAEVADDSLTVQTKRKMARVDEILRKLKASKERLLRQMQEEQWRQQQEESKAKQDLRRGEAEKMYEEALNCFRSHEYAKAKIKFLELENIIPNYKDTRRNLNRIDEDLKQSNVEAVTDYEKNEAAHLNRLQEKENAMELLRAQQDQEKQHSIELQQQASLKELAQKASDINDDIINLSHQQDYEGMKEKFTELENTVTALTTLKDEMAKSKDRLERNKQLARDSAKQRALMLRAEKSEDHRIHAYYNVQPLKEYRPILSNQPSDADHYKRREIMQEQNMLFSEGVDRYEHKQYTQAKLLFGELADQNDRRAEAWLKKVDHAITRELLRSQEGEERERTAFIADQVNAQRELLVIQERERQRQKKLTEELERQKRLYEDDRLLQLRKEEMMKAQELERQRQEEKRLKLEKASERQEAMLHFHKIIIKPEQVVVAPVAVSAAPAAMTAQQLQAQVDFSNKRKEFLDNKYKQEQLEKARQAKIKADEDARQKRIEERQKEIERRKELRAQREQERQARIKAVAEARQKRIEERQKEREHQQELKAQQDRLRAEQLVQEEKHRQEMLRQEAQEREEREKQENIMKEESQRREELERQEQQRQAQLEAKREAVRKQLEDGVEAMYQEALSLYQQGYYTAASEKFKDVQDIIPGYKRAGQYMDEARLKSISVNAQSVVTPEVTASPSSPISRDDSVSKALDLFDSNAK